MCDRRQRCLGGVPHYSKESSLHSCSVCGKLGAELLEHWLSSQQEMENNQVLFQQHLLHISWAWQESWVWLSGSAVPMAAVWQVGTAPSCRGALLPAVAQRPRTVQRLSLPPGFPGSPRAVGGTGSPAQPEGKEPGMDSPLAQQNLGAGESFVLH